MILSSIQHFSPDPDYENAENILGRLEENVTPSPLININCECLLKHTLTKKQQDLYSSTQFSGSDSDDEGWCQLNENTVDLSVGRGCT